MIKYKDNYYLKVVQMVSSPTVLVKHTHVNKHGHTINTRCNTPATSQWVAAHFNIMELGKFYYLSARKFQILQVVNKGFSFTLSFDLRV